MRAGATVRAARHVAAMARLGVTVGRVLARSGRLAAAPSELRQSLDGALARCCCRFDARAFGALMGSYVLLDRQHGAAAEAVAELLRGGGTGDGGTPRGRRTGSSGMHSLRLCARWQRRRTLARCKGWRSECSG